MDIEIASVLKKKPILKVEEQAKDIQHLQTIIIQKGHYSIVYNKKEGEVVHKCMFFLRDKHLYSSSAMKIILSSTKANKVNSAADNKCVSDMIYWYLLV